MIKYIQGDILKTTDPIIFFLSDERGRLNTSLLQAALQQYPDLASLERPPYTTPEVYLGTISTISVVDKGQIVLLLHTVLKDQIVPDSLREALTMLANSLNDLDPEGLIPISGPRIGWKRMKDWWEKMEEMFNEVFPQREVRLYIKE